MQVLRLVAHYCTLCTVSLQRAAPPCALTARVSTRIARSALEECPALKAVLREDSSVNYGHPSQDFLRPRAATPLPTPRFRCKWAEGLWARSRPSSAQSEGTTPSITLSRAPLGALSNRPRTCRFDQAGDGVQTNIGKKKKKKSLCHLLKTVLFVMSVIGRPSLLCPRGNDVVVSAAEFMIKQDKIAPSAAGIKSSLLRFLIFPFIVSARAPRSLQDLPPARRITQSRN